MNIKTICGKYPKLLDYGSIQKLLSLDKPIVTIAMLSYRRPKSLLKSLKQLLNSGIPLNLCLNVQGQEELSNKIKSNIETLTSKFYTCRLSYSDGNLGSGIPRHRVIEKSLTFDTPYIMTTDDDMMWPKYSIAAQISVLESLHQYGAIGSVCLPNYPMCYRDGNKTSQLVITEQFTEAEMMGSATTIYRRDVFDTCEYDKGYTIGLGDFDLCRQMLKNWKLGIINIPELNSLNDWDADAKSYIKERYNQPTIMKSRERFLKKWGFQG